MASHPAFTPTATWRGVMAWRASVSTDREMHIEVSRRRTFPTAIGRRLPPFLLQGRREAPQRCRMTSCGAWPAHNSLTTPVRARVAWSTQSGEGHRSASLRWFVLRPDWPRAESPGKDLRALRTSTSGRETGVRIGSEGMGGGGA